MAHTKVTKTGTQNTGTANTFSYSGSFNVFKASEVEVELDNVKLTFTTSTIDESASPREYTVDYSAKTIHIGGANLAGTNSVVIQPVTDMGDPTPRATFAPGSSVTSSDLNNNQLQLMRKAMEYDEQKLSSRGGTMTGNLHFGKDIDITFEGDTDNAYETTLTVADPTSDKTITLPDTTGTVVTTGDTGTVTATMLAANSVDSSELVDGSIDTSHIGNSQVTTDKIAADAVTGAKIADDAINSEHYTDGSIDTAHIADSQITTAKIADTAVTTAKITDGNVTTAKIAADAITAAKIADDVVNSEHYAAGSIDTEHIADLQVTTAKIAADAVTNAKIADDQIDSEHYVDGSIDTAHIGDSQVTTAKIADANITTAKLATDAVTTVKITDANVTTAKIATDAVTTAKINGDAVTEAKIANNACTANKVATNAVTTNKIAADAVTGAKIADDAVDSEHIAADSLDSEHYAAASVDTTALASNAVTTAKITDANVTTDKLAADSVTIAKIGCEQTTISNSDSHIPTSGAVVDYVAAQIAPIGGLEVIADEDSFPTTQPASGVVISISDAAGIVVNGSGVSTTARTSGNGSDNVTINNFPSSLYSETLASGVGLMVSSTGSSHTYNYHKILAAETDVKQLSDDINDFNARYRVNAGEPTSNNDQGDLVYDTNADKMKVYDSTTSAWKEVTSTGDFKYLFLCPAGGTGAPTLDGSIATYDLRESSNSGSAASVTNAAQLIVSINGVVQKANTGTSAPAEGFALVDANTIIFGANLASGDSVFIVQIGSAVSIPTPGDGTVSTAKIVNGAVTTAKIADANVTTAKIADDAVTAAKLASDAVVTASIVDANVTTAKIAGDAITGAKIADDQINSEHYVAGSIDHEHLANDIIDGDNIQDDVINSEHYVDGSIDTAHIADSQITTAKIATAAVTTAKIDGDAVTEAKIANNSCTANKVANNAVYTNAIQDDAVTNAKVADDAIGVAQLSASGTASSSTFLRGDNSWTAVTSTTINNNAANTLIAGSGTANELNANSKFKVSGGYIHLNDDNGGVSFGTAGAGSFGTTPTIARAEQSGYHVTTSGAGDLCIGAEHQNDILFGTTSSSSGGLTGRLKITASGHTTPASNNAHDLGEASTRWRNIYTNDLNLSNEGSSNDIDGTWGDWTIQEGESDLFLKNNRSGKKYKFNLTEVS